MDNVTLIRVISGIVVVLAFIAVMVIILIRLRRKGASLGYILVPIVVTFVIRLLPQPLDIGGSIGYTAGVMLIPSLVAYLMRGRKGDWRGFSRWFFWLDIFSFLLAFNAAHSGH